MRKSNSKNPSLKENEQKGNKFIHDKADNEKQEHFKKEDDKSKRAKRNNIDDN